MSRRNILKLEMVIVLVILPFINNDTLLNIFATILLGFNGLYLIYMFNKNSSLYLNSVNFSFLLLAIWYLILFVVHGDGTVRVIQLFLMISVYALFASNIDLDKESEYSFCLKFARNLEIFLLITWIIYFCFFTLDKFQVEYKAYYGNPNILGTMTITALIIFLIGPFHNKSMKFFFVIVDLLFCVISGSRSALLANIFIILFVFLSKNGKNVKHYKLPGLLFLLVLATIIIFTTVYPSLQGTPLGNTLNTLSRKYFNKNFFSGRQTVWKKVISIVNKHPYVGSGLSKVPENYINLPYSSHNLYLQSALQGGWINAALIINVFYQMYIKLRNSLNSKSIIISYYIIGMLIHQTFEVSVTQNNWPSGIAFWLIAGLGALIAGNQSTRAKVKL